MDTMRDMAQTNAMDTVPSQSVTRAAIKNDRINQVLEIMRRWKDNKYKGHITVHYDGSGAAVKIEECKFW